MHHIHCYHLVDSLSHVAANSGTWTESVLVYAGIYQWKTLASSSSWSSAFLSLRTTILSFLGLVSMNTAELFHL